MQASGSTAHEILDLVNKVGPLIAEAKDRVVQGEALAEFVSVYLLSFPEAEREAALANFMNTVRGLTVVHAAQRAASRG